MSEHASYLSQVGIVKLRGESEIHTYQIKDNQTYLSLEDMSLHIQEASSVILIHGASNDFKRHGFLHLDAM